MTTPDQLAAIEARADAAYPAPWKAWDRGIGYEVHTIHDEPLNYQHRETFGKADAEFIANARTDVPALLAMVREQRARLDAVLALCDTAEKYGVYHVIQAATIRAAITATEAAK